MKKLFSLIIALAMCLSMCSAAFASGSPQSPQSPQNSYGGGGGGTLKENVSAVDANGKTAEVFQTTLGTTNAVSKAVKDAGSAEKFLEFVGLKAAVDTSLKKNGIDAGDLKVHSLLDISAKSGTVYPVTIQIPLAGVKKSDAVVFIHKAADGYEIVKAKVVKSGVAQGTFSSLSPVVALVGTSAMPFADVPESAYYYNAVIWASANEIANGLDTQHFVPGNNANRAQMVTFLWKAAGSPEPAAKTCPFTDVKADAYYYKAVLWAYENKITAGTTTTTFSPDKTVSRGQAVAFMARMCGVKDTDTGYTHNFTDVKVGSYYSNAVAWAYQNKITDGKTATTFAPNDNCLRSHIVTFLYNYFGK